MMERLTKRQMKAFARIQSGLIILNGSGTEFDDSDMPEEDKNRMQGYMHEHAHKLLREYSEEYALGSTEEILEYVRKYY